MSVQRIKPSEQGDLDGACGFYAVVNAIRALEPELDPKELFTQAVKSHLLDGDPMAFVKGTSRGEIKNILSRVLEYVHYHYDLYDNLAGESYCIKSNIPYWHLDKERDRDDVLSILKGADYKSGVVCIVGYSFSSGIKGSEQYAHWSVVRKVEDESMQLLDSSGEKRKISFSEIRVDSFNQNHNSARPYNVISADIFVISRIKK